MLYSRFASNLFHRGIEKGFQLMGADASGPSEATYFHMQKVERITTFLYITVIDASRADWQALLEKDMQTRTQAENLLDRVQNVALIYLLVEPATQIDPVAVPQSVTEPYDGQSVYSVFWRISLDNGEITALPNQPSELFGLRTMVEAAYETAVSPEPSFNAVAAAESILGGGSTPTASERTTRTVPPTNVVPLRKTPVKTPSRKVSLMTRLRYMNTRFYPKYQQPYLAYTLLMINAMVMAGVVFLGDMTMVQFGFLHAGIFAPAVVYGGEWWRLFTAMFVHFDIMHLLANSFGIVVFGTRIERYFGRSAFLVIYFGTGLMGSIFSFLNLYFRNSLVTSGGASGAVYGLVASVFIITRITDQIIETLHWRIMLVFIGIGLVMGFLLEGIDNAGHIGGMVGGVIVGFLYLLFLLNKQDRK